MDKFIESRRRKASKAKTIVGLHRICAELWIAGHSDEANKFLRRYLVTNFGFPKAKAKPPGKRGRKGGLPQQLDLKILRYRQQGLTQFEAGLKAHLEPDRPVIENRVRDVERRFLNTLHGSRAQRREYESALRKQANTHDLYVTRWGVVTSAEMFEAFDQDFRAALESIEKLNKQPLP